MMAQQATENVSPRQVAGVSVLSPILIAFRAVKQLSAVVVVCQSNTEKRKRRDDGKAGEAETRAMWIMAVLAVLLIFAGMGWKCGLTPTALTEAEADASKTQSVGDRSAALDCTRLTQEPI
jgi:uncharacterized membrane protein